MADTHLEIGQSRTQHRLNGQRDDLRVRFGTVVVEVFHAHLGAFLQTTLIGGIIAEHIAVIAETQRHMLFIKIHRDSARDRRCKIRTQRQRIAFSVEKLIQFTDRGRTDLPPEHFQKFKRRRLDGLIAVGTVKLLDLPFQIPFFVAFSSENVSDAFRRVDPFFHFFSRRPPRRAAVKHRRIRAERSVPPEFTSSSYHIVYDCQTLSSRSIESISR